MNPHPTPTALPEAPIASRRAVVAPTAPVPRPAGEAPAHPGPAAGARVPAVPAVAVPAPAALVPRPAGEAPTGRDPGSEAPVVAAPAASAAPDIPTPASALPAASAVPAAVVPARVGSGGPGRAADPAGPAQRTPQHRPVVTELRLSAFGPHRGAAFPLGPVTLLAGPSGSGKSQALAAYQALAVLGSGATLDRAFPEPALRIPDLAVPDSGRRRGFRIGCTVDGPAGPVRLDLAVQAEPDLRIVGERLSQDGQVLLTTALRDPGRRSVQAAWLTGGATGVTRAPLPDDRLGTALLPLRVAGATAGQRQVLAAAEQVVVALRSVFPCDPDPERMRAPVPPGEGRLRGDCANLADVLRRTRHECGTRHGLLTAAARTACTGPVAGLEVRAPAGGPVTAVLDRGPARPATELARLGAGELRFLALALVLLTGPGVLAMDPAAELLSAQQALTVLADGLDRGLDRRQGAELLRLAQLACAHGHVRLAAAVGEDLADLARGLPGITVVDLTP